ncbi:leucine-rich repeat extensin-like protein 5 [Callorhinchus milii]|uniref:leucine-rich repeat extensin-like protein 5 n=1 Tax=Callorhinchus milii TaxID=7868 RepID=UPI001C3F8317|nr:leucine-rich repeat extensin-like protein 5 [Callorhinchus milii]
MCFLKKRTSPAASLSVSASWAQTVSELSNSQDCVLAQTLSGSHTEMSRHSAMPGSVSQKSGINPAFTGSLLPMFSRVIQSAVAITTCTASDGSPFAADTQRRQGEPTPNQDLPSLAVLLRGASQDMEPLVMTAIPAQVGDPGPPCLVLALTTAALSTLALPPLAVPTLAPLTRALPTPAAPTLTPLPLALPTLGQSARAPLAPDALAVLPAVYSPSRCPDSGCYAQKLEVKPRETVRQPAGLVLLPATIPSPLLPSPQTVPTGHSNLPGHPEPCQPRSAKSPDAHRGSGRPGVVGLGDTTSRSHPAHHSPPDRARASKHSPSLTTPHETPLPAPEEVSSLQYQDRLWSGSETARLSQGRQVTQPLTIPRAGQERTVRQIRADNSDTSSDEDRLVIET